MLLLSCREILLLILILATALQFLLIRIPIIVTQVYLLLLYWAFVFFLIASNFLIPDADLPNAF